MWETFVAQAQVRLKDDRSVLVWRKLVLITSYLREANFCFDGLPCVETARCPQFSLVPAARPDRMHEDSVEAGDCSVAAVQCCFVKIDVDIAMVLLHV